MSTRTYITGKVRTLEISGALVLVIHLKPQPRETTDITVGLYDPPTEFAGDDGRPALSWCMGSQATLQDDALGDPRYAALWLNATSFRIATEHVPALLNFFGGILIDARTVAKARTAHERA